MSLDYIAAGTTAVLLIYNWVLTMEIREMINIVL